MKKFHILNEYHVIMVRKGGEIKYIRLYVGYNKIMLKSLTKGRPIMLKILSKNLGDAEMFLKSQYNAETIEFIKIERKEEIKERSLREEIKRKKTTILKIKLIVATIIKERSLIEKIKRKIILLEIRIILCRLQIKKAMQ